jgi:mannose-6-phosphate isomerase-like protein (cupin superfamily)
METSINYTVIERNDLPHDLGTSEFEGHLYSDTEVSFIWVDMPPGGSIRLHQHPYKEIFIVQEGVSTFVVGSATIEAHAGQIIIVPANVPHKFTNATNAPLKQIDIHVSPQFVTQWLEE